MTRNILIMIAIMLTAGATVAGAELRFDHREHVEVYLPGVACAECHVPEAPTIVPDRSVCLNCHDEFVAEESEMGAIRTHGVVWALNHGSEARSKGMDCSACHQQNFCQECHQAGFADEMGKFGNHMLNVHRSDFHVTHPIAARTDQRTCAACHEPKFCSDCHGDFRERTGRASGPSHRRVFGMGLDIDFNHAALSPELAANCDLCHQPDSVAPFHEWTVGHAREARKNLQTCQTCHPGGDVCLNCHSAVGGAGQFNPHGRNWRDRAGRLKDASGERTCRMCHDPVP
jgi:hypothetical protein